MKILFLFLIPLTTFAQIYSFDEGLGQTQSVDAVWLPGTIVTAQGETLEGQVRGFVYNAAEVKSFRYRSEKGAKAVTYKADDCQLVVYDGLIVLSLPKNLKKPKGKREFYVSLYHGKNISILQDPKAKVVKAGGNSFSLNLGENLNYLCYKNGSLYKITRLSYRKQLQKILGDNPQWVKKATDKKWLKYNNLAHIAQFYDETLSQ
ncbi:MAG: hypothetical protein ACPH28_03720 [Flavobacteriaceae bacterium]